MFDDREASVAPDGNTLLMTSGKTIRAYSADTGKERFRLKADPVAVSKLALSSDGQTFATFGNGPDQKSYNLVSIWNLRDARQLAQFRVPSASYCSVLEFTPDGKQIVSASTDKVLRFWDTKTGELVGTIELPERPARVAFDGGKRVAVALWDTTILIYDREAALRPTKKEGRP